MNEKIIFAPGCNEAELLRTLAMFGVNTFGYRVADTVELAIGYLNETGNHISNLGFISRNNEADLIHSFIKAVPYFSTAAYTDSQKMAESLYNLRSLIVNDEKTAINEQFIKGDFPEKNQAIADVYNRYCEKLNKKKLIDTIGIIRRALESPASPRQDNREYIVLEEYRLTPIEKALYEKVSGTKYLPVKLSKLFKQSEDTTDKNTFEITEAYGLSNEVENVLSFIYKNKIPLDKCVVAVTDSSYARLFEDISLKYGFKVLFGNGIPLLYSNPAKLLKAYFEWDTGNVKTPETLKALLLNEAVDIPKLKEKLGLGSEENSLLYPLIETGGNLRLSSDKDSNDGIIRDFEALTAEEYASVADATVDRDKLMPALKSLALLLEMSCTDFINELTKIRNNEFRHLDSASKTAILRRMECFRDYSESDDYLLVAETILGGTIDASCSSEGALYVTTVRGALDSMRENLFIVGLSYDFYPGTQKENYIVLDNDYKLLSADCAPTSDIIIKDKISDYNNLVGTAASLGVSVHLSFSCFDLAALKEKNISSVVRLKYETKDDHTVPVIDHRVGFFDASLSETDNEGKAYRNGKTIDKPLLTAPAPGELGSKLLERSYTPSNIETYFTCPKKFFLGCILGIREPDEYHPYEVIDAKDFGNLFHKVMEYSGNSDVSLDKLLDYARKIFDCFLKANIPPSEYAASLKKAEFLKAVANGYEMNAGKEIVNSEAALECVHSDSGIRLHGRVDRIEKTVNGNYIIVDFKTGSKEKQTADDIDTCIQTVLYAYMAENASNETGSTHFTIEKCEYRYPRNKSTVSCKYDDEMKDRLTEKLKEFKAGLESESFPCRKQVKNEKDSPCNFCKFKSICGINDNEEDE